MVSTNYFINELKNNIYNKNELVYADGLTGDIDIRGDIWTFTLNLFITGDFHLPLNCLICNFVTPFGAVSNIPLNENTFYPIPKEVQWSDMTRCFGCRLSFDTSQIDFFKHELIEEKIQYRLTFDIDDKVFSKSEIDTTQSKSDKFINELLGCQTTGSFECSNSFHAVDNRGSFFNINKYYLSTYESSRMDGSLVTYKYSPSLFQRDEPIREFVKLKSFEKFTVCNYEINVSYEIDGVKKQIVFQSKDAPLECNEYNITIQDCTFFDERKNEIKIQNDGINGFYSPIEMNGKITCVITIKEDSEKKKIQFCKDFSFVDDFNIKHLNVKVESAFINDIKKFEEISF